MILGGGGILGLSVLPLAREDGLDLLGLGLTSPSSRPRRLSFSDDLGVIDLRIEAVLLCFSMCLSSSSSVL